MEFHKKISKRSSIIFTFFLICLIYYLFKLISSSVFLKGRDKINVVFYGEKTRFYSLDRKNINYVLFFPNSIKLIVPGGYGRYKIGAIGKLVSLEKNQDIFKKVFSAATSSFVDLYFYQKKPVVYYDDSASKQKPAFIEIFLSNSNSNLIDRLFLLYIFSISGKENFHTIDISPFESKDDNAIFDGDSFYKEFQGSFFQRIYRKYDVNVQILFSNSYKTAQFLSRVIEGEGIRVVDLIYKNPSGHKCLLIAGKKVMETKTFQHLVDFFKCKTQVGETTVSDITLELGDLEKEWAVN